MKLQFLIILALALTYVKGQEDKSEETKAEDDSAEETLGTAAQRYNPYGAAYQPNGNGAAYETASSPRGQVTGVAYDGSAGGEYEDEGSSYGGASGGRLGGGRAIGGGAINGFGGGNALGAGGEAGAYRPGYSGFGSPQQYQQQNQYRVSPGAGPIRSSIRTQIEPGYRSEIPPNGENVFAGNYNPAVLTYQNQQQQQQQPQAFGRFPGGFGGGLPIGGVNPAALGGFGGGFGGPVGGPAGGFGISAAGFPLGPRQQQQQQQQYTGGVVGYPGGAGIGIGGFGPAGGAVLGGGGLGGQQLINGGRYQNSPYAHSRNQGYGNAGAY